MTKTRKSAVIRYKCTNQALKPHTNPTPMKTILLLVTLIFSAMAVSSCTNDENETEFEYINPNEEQQTALKTEVEQERK